MLYFWYWYGFLFFFCKCNLECWAYSNKVLKSFSSWKFANSRLQQLPIDHEKRNFVREVKRAIFSHVSPTPLQKSPRLVLLSRGALENCLEINYSSAFNNVTFRDFVCGNLLLNASLSHRYNAIIMYGSSNYWTRN